jgi:ribosomal protein L31E
LKFAFNKKIIAVGQFFATKVGTDFFKRGIKKLPERWRTLVSKNGDYLTD